MRKKCPSCHGDLDVDLNQRQDWISCPSCRRKYEIVELERLTSRMEKLRQIAEFEIENHLGSGEFADVFAAVDQATQQGVALKVPHDESLQQRTFLTREYRVAKHLDHPSIIKVHRMVDSDPSYLVFELVDGAPLNVWLKKRKRIGQTQAAELCAKLADAMQFAHAHGVIHRDLKPSNILIGQDGHPHITDFGMARCEFDDEMISRERHQQALMLLASGRISAKGVARMGTPGYMSPEQARGENATHHSDVYSLGVILYELLTGRRPFRGDSQSVMRQVLRHQPATPRRLDRTISPDIENVCMKAMSKRVLDRYESAGELAQDCRRFFRTEPVEAGSPPRPFLLWRWARWHPIEVCALLFVLIASAVFVFWFISLNAST